MKKGQVKFYNKEKGYGFITNQDTKEDIFVHHSGLSEDVKMGDQVQYEEIQGKKGLNATKVRKA
jgi:CspA family cold shock protein